MAAPTSPFDLDTTASNNQPPASEGLSSGDDQIRALAACVKQLVVKGADIPSAGTITPAATASFFDVTGTTTITAIGSSASWDGRVVWLQFDGALTLTHSSTLKLPDSLNYTTVAGDILAFAQETSGTWRCISSSRKMRPAFRAGINVAATSGSASTFTKVAFDQEHVDIGSWFSSGTATCPRSGTVMVGFTLGTEFHVDSSPTIYLQGVLYQGGSAVTGARVEITKNAAINFTGREGASWAGVISVASGDTLEVYSTTNDSTRSATFQSGNSCFFAYYID